jgi:hypothetical protein
MEGHVLEYSILNVIDSDHWPIQFGMDIVSTHKHTPFIFKKFWLSYPDFQQNDPRWWVEAIIPHGMLMYKFEQKLENFKLKLKAWNKDTFGNIFQAQRELEQK